LEALEALLEFGLDFGAVLLAGECRERKAVDGTACADTGRLDLLVDGLYRDGGGLEVVRVDVRDVVL